MKSKEELNAIQNEVETLNAKLAELTDDEMEFVAGGVIQPIRKEHDLVRRYTGQARLEAWDLIFKNQEDEDGKDAY